ncbi:MAG: hypothetical protein AB1611_01915 [bacterium]
MPIQLKLRKEQIEGLSFIRDLGASKIREIIEKLSSLDPSPLRPSALYNALNDILSNSFETNIILNQLMSLYTLRRRRDLKVQDLLEGLLYGIKTGEPPWTDEQISRWEELNPDLQNLLTIPNVWTVVKALDLSYDYTNLLQNVKVLTDIRPVFNEDASHIQGTIISYTLRLYYDSLEGSKSLSIALDHNDIKRLLEICERALRKGETAQKMMEEAGLKATHICGEEE